MSGICLPPWKDWFIRRGMNLVEPKEENDPYIQCINWVIILFIPWTSTRHAFLHTQPATPLMTRFSFTFLSDASHHHHHHRPYPSCSVTVEDISLTLCCGDKNPDAESTQCVLENIHPPIFAPATPFNSVWPSQTYPTVTWGICAHFSRVMPQQYWAQDPDSFGTHCKSNSCCIDMFSSDWPSLFPFSHSGVLLSRPGRSFVIYLFQWAN